MKLSLLMLLPTLLLSFGATANAQDNLTKAAQRIEEQLGARVGLAVHDTGTDTWWLYKSDQRFPMASTFKVLACAALLASDVDDSPTQQVQDLQDYSPVTEHLVGQFISPYQLCSATMRTSDNTAANLVLQAIGGPSAVTEYVRSLGDDITRLDRSEPEVNQSTPRDLRDTTTPQAFADTLERLVLGNALAAPDKSVLTSWLRSNEVGGPMLRAGIPSDWTIGDRTGAGGHGTRGIVSVMWPGNAAPVVAAIFLTETTASMDERNAAFAELGRVIANTISETVRSQ